MRFATLPNGPPDGRLHIVSRDNSRAAPCAAAETMQAALEQWDAIQDALQAEYAAVNNGAGTPFDPTAALAPLPRAWQWLDASAFESHGTLMDQAFKVVAEKIPGKPLMYQGVSDEFYSCTQDVPFPSEVDGIDFEGEFGLITTATPMEAANPGAHIALLIQLNDWSLRKLACRACLLFPQSARGHNDRHRHSFERNVPRGRVGLYRRAARDRNCR